MQEPVYVLHLITCHGRIMPRLAELLPELWPFVSFSQSSTEVLVSATPPTFLKGY